MRSLRVLIFSVCIFSCKSSVPKDILPPEKMRAVLWDLMQADEMTEYYSAKDSTFRTLSKHVSYYQKIFSIHKITKQDFSRSLNYYENHPATLKTLLDSLHKFSEQLQKADSLNKKPYNPIKKDTIKRKLPMTAK